MSEFMSYFTLQIARTKAELKQLQHLRWEVYCREFHYEREEDCPDEREADTFDASAVHLYAVHRSTGVLAGTVRIVCADALDGGAALPLEQAYANQALEIDLDSLPRSHLIEISRLAVAAQFRRRSGERFSPLGFDVLSDPDQQAITERSFPLLPVALYLSVAALVEVRGVHEALGYAMMQPRLVRLLTRFGIQFRQVGPTIDYHGERAAYCITLDEVVSRLDPKMQNLYSTLIETLAGVLPKSREPAASICEATTVGSL